MRRSLATLGLGLLAFTPVLIPAAAKADDRYANRWEGGLQLGGLLLEGGSRYVPHVESGPRVGYNLDNTVAGEFSLLVGKAGIEDDSRNATTYLPTTEGLYHFGGNADLRPFVAAGIGVFSSDGPPGASDTDVVFPFGGGVKWMLSENLFARGDIRWVVNTAGGEDLNQGYYSVGLSWLFDGPAKQTARIEEPAAAPKVEQRSRLSDAAKTLERDKQVSLRLLVEFETAKTDIQARYRQELLDVAAFLNEHPNTKTEIEGHTDNVGSKAYNQSLSLRRAQAVRHFLLTEGKVNPSKLIAKGYGFSRPIASNASEAGKARNRRVIAAVRVEE